MSPHDDDLALWGRLRDGDEHAFTALYRLHADRVYRYCYRRTLSDQDSQDLTAEAFAQAWRSRERIYIHDSAGGIPWLLVLVNNLLRRRRHSLQRARRLLDKSPRGLSEPDHADQIADDAADAHTLLLLAQVLDLLSRRDREVIQLCVLEGLNPTAVAHALGEVPGSVRSRLSRALTRARQHYQRLSTVTSPDNAFTTRTSP